jgi:MFS family permease
MSQFESQFGALSPTVQGLLVSSIIATAALSSVGSGALSDRISRTYTISLGAFVFSIGCAIACSAKALPQLFVGRCITGFGEGVFISSITVYVMEISPTSKRGRTMTTVQLLNTIGVAAGKYASSTLLGLIISSQDISHVLQRKSTQTAFPGGSRWGCRPLWPSYLLSGRHSSRTRLTGY